MARQFHPVSLNKRLIPRMCYYPSLNVGIHSVKGKRTISGSLHSKHPHKASFPAAASLPILPVLDAQPVLWMHAVLSQRVGILGMGLHSHR